jgi:hypothetical protein
MLDLTGENLSTYLLREIKDIVNRNPRFRNMGGDATVHTNSMVGWGDLRVTISGISSQGTRMSPDYFMCNQYGRAVLCKLENYDGLFMEWVQELKDTSTSPQPGVYYFNVDSVDEATREVVLTVQKYRWESGKSKLALGSNIFFRKGIDVGKVRVFGSSVQIEQNGDMISVLTFDPAPLALRLVGASSNLVPMVDYWYLRKSVYVLPATVLGTQDIHLPLADYCDVTIVDQDDYELKAGRDFDWIGTDKIRTTEWTPAGAILTVTYTIKADPTAIPAAHPENLLEISSVTTGEVITSGQTTLYASNGNRYGDDQFIQVNGELWLKNLLKMGESYTWDSRVDCGQTQVTAKKFAANTNLIDGLSIGIGDQVFVNDQCAILISPEISETYEVYGAKENVSFNIEVKSNDRMTSSEIAEALRGHLLVRSRDNFEANGLSIFEVSKSSDTGSRDSSGTAPSTTYNLEVSAAADWELYVPLVTRITQFAVDTSEETPAIDFPGKLSATPRIAAFGSSKFLPYYS